MRVFPAEIEVDVAARFGEFRGVAEDIREDLRQARRIAFDRQPLVGNGDRENVLAGLERRPGGLGRLRDE